MVRGVIRGGRGVIRGGIRPPFKKTFVPRHPFDLTLAEVLFPKVSPLVDDTALTTALLKRNQDLSPSPSEQTTIANLVSKVQGVLDNLVLAPGDFSTCQLDEVRQVGSFKKGTLITGNNVADIVVILKTLPTKEACEALAKKVEADLKNAMKTEVLTKADQLTTTMHDGGFNIANWQAKVRVLIATIPQNIRKLEAEIHLDPKAMQAHLAAIRHTRWFEENAHHSSIKVLIRILKDLTTRFDAFSPLSPWMLDLIAHLSIMNNPSRQALPINLAFRRVFQLLSAGLFLPGSAGITDPCEPGHIRVHTAMTLEQQDICCLTAQTLLRVIAHGGYKHILGLEGNTSIAREMSVWDGVVVSPLEHVYEKPIDKKDGEDEDMEEVENAGVVEDDTMQLDEVRQVGSFKKGTLITGNNVADIVVILKTLPTKEACEALAKKVEADLKNAMKTEVLTKADQLTTTMHDGGFNIANWQAKVRVLIATIPQNIRKLEAEIHLDPKAMQAHLAAIRHTRWFEENAHHSSIKVLIRILKDLTTRFDAFSPLSPWMLDLIAHLSIMNNPSRQALPINLAFRRVFQLLSAGLFLPGSAGITDPCEPGHIRVHTAMTLEQQDICCLTAQTLLRVIAHGGYKHILGLEGNTSIAREMSVWDGVVVSPLEHVYEKPIDKKDGEDEDMEEVENAGVVEDDTMVE